MWVSVCFYKRAIYFPGYCGVSKGYGYWGIRCSATPLCTFNLRICSIRTFILRSTHWVVMLDHWTFPVNSFFRRPSCLVGNIQIWFARISRSYLLSLKCLVTYICCALLTSLGKLYSASAIILYRQSLCYSAILRYNLFVLRADCLAY